MGRVEDTLRRAPLFQGLDDAAAENLRTRMADLDVARGRTIFHEGDPGDALYVVLTGKIKLVRHAPDGRENLLAVLGPAEMFGELSVFDPGPRQTTATAVTKARVKRLLQAEVGPWLAEHPEVALSLLHQLAARLRRTSETAADLVFTDVPGRVAKALLELSQRFGVSGPDGLRVHHDLTQEELAQLVGASRETVNKALAEFAQRGWIKLEQKSVTLTDVERLRRRSK
jgi:CRP/FNR family cyclic AMP-dependent transcriptional regulator